MKPVPLVIAAVLLCAPIEFDSVPKIPNREVAVVEQVKTQPKKTETKKQSFTVYTIHGITPNVEWQKALYKELKRNGIAWYMPYAVCQIFQESRWNQYADSGKGDKGITQQKEVYWYGRAARYGASGASIWDVYAQFKVYAGMMAGYLKSSKNDIGWALSYYFYGNGQRADKYVHDVLSHMDYLKEVK